MKLHTALTALTLALVSSSSFAAGKVIEVGTGDPKNKKDFEAQLFNVPEISIKAGEEVTIKFTNRSKSPGMMHNMIITKPGKDKDVAKAALSAAATQWIPKTSEILFNTPTLDAGKSATMVVKIADAGEYPYICTFPGHYPSMKGTLKVTK